MIVGTGTVFQTWSVELLIDPPDKLRAEEDVETGKDRLAELAEEIGITEVGGTEAANDELVIPVNDEDVTETEAIEEALDIPVEVDGAKVVAGVLVILVNDDDTTGVDEGETNGEELVAFVEDDNDELVVAVEDDETEADKDKLVPAVDVDDAAAVDEAELQGTGMVTILPPDITNLEHRSWVTIERADPGTTVTSPITLLATPFNVERIAPTMDPTSPALPGAFPTMLDSLAGRSDSGILLGSGSPDSS